MQGAEYSKREGSDRDVKELEIVWKKFGCTVNTFKNLDKSQLLKSLKDFQKQVNSLTWIKEFRGFVGHLCSQYARGLHSRMPFPGNHIFLKKIQEISCPEHSRPATSLPV